MKKMSPELKVAIVPGIALVGLLTFTCLDAIRAIFAF